MSNTSLYCSTPYRFPRLPVLILAAAGLLIAAGNAGAQQPGAGDAELKDAVQQLKNAKAEFLQQEDFLQRFRRLNELEQQALQLIEDEPLKLGSLGSAILDIYPASQTGHYLMREFYTHVEAADALARHTGLLDHLQTRMREDGNGSRDEPYPIMTVYDAHTFMLSQQESPVGAIYQSNNQAPLGYMLVTRPDNGSLTHTSFDLQHLLAGFSRAAARESAPEPGIETGQETGEETAKDAAAEREGIAADDNPVESAPPPQRADFDYAGNPWILIRLFAAGGDHAAQSAIGAYLASLQKYDQAIGWLRVASRSGNVLANRLLARIYFAQAEEADANDNAEELKDLALENHMHAIALGSTESMYTLANLYLNNYFGEDNRAAGLPLLRKAGNLGHTESLIYLGHLYNNGKEVEQDVAQADTYFSRAAANDDPQALLNYGRFLAAGKDRQANPNIFNALRELAKDGDAEGMVVLGNLYARGIGAKASNRTAIRWYKRAVRQAPDNPDIVNEVAWTLTVSDIQGLQRGKYAKRIMDTMMVSDAARERPEYLDTWAAAHAAIGDFDQAIKLQEQAIEVAAAQQRDDVMDILREHLEQFKTGNTITEPAP